MTDTCHNCGIEYEKIAQHWSTSEDCEHPKLSDHQREIVIGLLMGDGTIGKDRKNPRIVSSMISQNYLEYVDNELGVFGHGVSLKTTAEENAKKSRESGFSLNAKPENYSDVYEWKSMGHPELQEFANWYDTGEKVWPKSIELTPTTLNHWYCGDGHYNNRTGNNYIEIAVANEINNREKINEMFENVGLPSPSNYDISKREDGSKRCSAQFSVEASRELFDYMGEPLPGFEYKWPKS